MRFKLFAVVGSLVFQACGLAAENAPNPPLLTIADNWQLQPAAKVSQPAEMVSKCNFQTDGWMRATVPGTVLTSLVDDKIYPEPLFGENNRPDKIPESLCRESWWYRTTFVVPENYAGKRIWLNFDGINYSAEIWLNGQKMGTMHGAFARGIFDISTHVVPGKAAALAVLIAPQPHPGEPHEHTQAGGMGRNGGITAMDGPTFLCAIGWDWMPAIRDRDSGLWQKVFLSATGPVLVKDPLVTSDLPLPRLDAADLTVQAAVENTGDTPQTGTLRGMIGEITFNVPMHLAAHTSQTVSLDSKSTPQLHVKNPRLWWPNGYGEQNLYSLRLQFVIAGAVSDEQTVPFGIRKITYSVPGSENLTLSVNGVRIFCNGGDWGMDEALKRIPRARLEAEIRMHQIANYNFIRNWVGQSTGEDFYELCDRYGLLLWDEFFQPNPSDGPNPADLDTYLANVRDKILHFRNHPSIAIWCARNEGYPPKLIDDALQKLMAELEPVRLYQPSSTAGRGVYSHGPYCWRTPREFYTFGTNDIFKTEIGSVSIPTLESIQGMMPAKDWETINDDWAEHDLARGAQKGDQYPQTVAARYGDFLNLADFTRKAQLANYESFRAMYEGREAKMFKPCTGVITWMSNPAQPSFVWQLYHHDLEPNAALFAVKKACELVHIQLNEKNGEMEVINHLPAALLKAKALVKIYNLDGTLAGQHEFAVNAAATSETTLGLVAWPTDLSAVHFVKLELRDGRGKLLSDNFYWRTLKQDDFQALGGLPAVTLDAKIKRHDSGGKCRLEVTLHNPGPPVALMTHLQLRRKDSGERVLPVYYSDNYVSLVAGETRELSIEAAESNLQGELPLVVVDGWNGVIRPLATADAAMDLNENAQISHWPKTGLPFAAAQPSKRLSQ
ncbi:MAG: glycoside hydrolase family 2 TIM barrel-domain containing protein [Verrucomicrobiae bacterium]|nr:glycoside hydrolase family 2 TIM barrel-domain containing protein [Verrucomicrobiae bacterium]